MCYKKHYYNYLQARSGFRDMHTFLEKAIDKDIILVGEHIYNLFFGANNNNH